MTTAAEHLHDVLTDLDTHVGAAWTAVAIRGHRVVIQTDLDDLPGVLAAFGLGSAHPEPTALARGDSWVVVPLACEEIHNGDRWRVWAAKPVTHGEYAALVAASHP